MTLEPIAIERIVMVEIAADVIALNAQVGGRPIVRNVFRSICNIAFVRARRPGARITRSESRSAGADEV